MRWKKLAQLRAAEEAAKIGEGAEERALAQWEAKRIQAMALATAKASAEEAKKNAESTKSKTFIVDQTSELVVTINGKSMTFKTVEEKDAYMISWNRNNTLAVEKEQLAITAKESWKVQRDIVFEIIAEAEDI